MYRDGVDVIFHAAGGSGDGVFEGAAVHFEETAANAWVIGVDFDQFVTVGGPRAAEWRQHILTSVVKHADIAVYEAVREFAEGRFTPGSQDYGLASNALELSYSGGGIEPYRSQIEALRGRIVSGEIDIPCLPEDRLVQAAALGLPAGACVHSSIPQ